MRISMRREVRRLLLVLGAGVVAACLVAAFFVWQYGPTGRYNIHQVLITPEVLAHLNYKDHDRFIFDRITLFTGGSKRVIDLETYGKIYATISADTEVAAVAMASFIKLLLSVRTERPPIVTKTFQEIEFAEDYYRLKTQDGQYIYFYHPRIKDEIMKIIQ